MGIYLVCEKHGRLPVGAKTCPECDKESQTQVDRYSVDIDGDCIKFFEDPCLLFVNLDSPCPYCGQTHKHILVDHRRIKVLFKQYYIRCPKTGKELKPFYLP